MTIIMYIVSNQSVLHPIKMSLNQKIRKSLQLIVKCHHQSQFYLSFVHHWLCATECWTLCNSRRYFISEKCSVPEGVQSWDLSHCKQPPYKERVLIYTLQELMTECDISYIFLLLRVIVFNQDIPPSQLQRHPYLRCHSVLFQYMWSLRVEANQYRLLSFVNICIAVRVPIIQRGRLGFY